MVLTVEPGIYVAQDSPKSEVIEPYSGNGIRIEDDVLITDNGCQVLSRGAESRGRDRSADEGRMSGRKHIAIAGGGLVGAVTALALQQRGFDISHRSRAAGARPTRLGHGHP